MDLALLDVLLFTTTADDLLAFYLLAIFDFPPYFFLLAMVFVGPLRVRALVLLRWPRTGRPRRWRMPR